MEHEDELYSARQLAARDTEERALRAEKLAPSPTEPVQPARIEVNAEGELAEVALDLNDNECAALSAQPQKPAATVDRAKPLAVTTSTFRAAAPKKKESAGPQDGSRKDNTFPRPVHATEKAFVGVQALKDSLEESLKENEQPKRKQARQETVARAPFIFQVRFRRHVRNSGRRGSSRRPPFKKKRFLSEHYI